VEGNDQKGQGMNRFGSKTIRMKYHSKIKKGGRKNVVGKCRAKSLRGGRQRSRSAGDGG